MPGCRAARFLEVHHIVPRSRGGTHEPGNLVVLCSAHHARVHDGSLVVRGRAPDGLELTWRDEEHRASRAPSAVTRQPPDARPARWARAGSDGDAVEAPSRPVSSAGLPESAGSEREAMEAPSRIVSSATVLEGVPPATRQRNELAADTVGALRRLGVDGAHARAAVTEALAAQPSDIETLLRRALVVLYQRVYAARFAGSSRGAAVGPG